MIAALLLFPFIAGAVMILIKSRKLNNTVLVLYAAAFLAAFCLHWARPVEISPYFRVDSLNILFLLVLGTVNLGVSYTQRSSWGAATSRPAGTRTTRSAFSCSSRR